MNDDAVERLRHLCGGPRDGALLRMSLANALIASGQAQAAVTELRQALTFDPDYSAAWKVLGNTLATSSDSSGARDAFECGIDAATRRGDKQAVKEMQVFLRRLQKNR